MDPGTILVGGDTTESLIGAVPGISSLIKHESKVHALRQVEVMSSDTVLGASSLAIMTMTSDSGHDIHVDSLLGHTKDDGLMVVIVHRHILEDTALPEVNDTNGDCHTILEPLEVGMSEDESHIGGVTLTTLQEELERRERTIVTTLLIDYTQSGSGIQVGLSLSPIGGHHTCNLKVFGQGSLTVVALATHSASQDTDDLGESGAVLWISTQDECNRAHVISQSETHYRLNPAAI